MTICVPRTAHHIPAGVLRVPGGEEVVGAVLQAALARHYRHLSQGSPCWGSWQGEGDGEGYEEDSHPVLLACVHTLHQALVFKAEVEVS